MYIISNGYKCCCLMMIRQAIVRLIQAQIDIFTKEKHENEILVSSRDTKKRRACGGWFAKKILFYSATTSSATYSLVASRGMDGVRSGRGGADVLIKVTPNCRLFSQVSQVADEHMWTSPI